MTDLRLERVYPIAPTALFDLVSTPDALCQWFGPEGVDIETCEMDFTRLGPWVCVMVGRESGEKFKVSGQVTHVEAPVSVGFTWAWHDDADQRGSESHVTFSVSAAPEGARLMLDHRDLDDSEQSQQHNEGWTSTLRKLENLTHSIASQGVE